MGALVSFSRTSTVSLCSGGLTIATLNLDEARSCGASTSAAAKSAAHQNIPSWAGAVTSSSVQYNALVPGQGVSCRLPWAITVPAWSLTRIVLPLRSHPAEDLAPTLMLNRSPMTTGEGTAHTARLVACGFVRTQTGSVQPACSTPAL